MGKQLIGVDDLAKKLGVSRSWVYTRTRENGPDSIPRVKMGKYVKFSEDVIDRWIEKKMIR